MAIQTVKTGAAVNDGTGDDARTAFTKINQNFTDSANAASRLVGEAPGNVMGVGAFGLGHHTKVLGNINKDVAGDNPKINSGFYEAYDIIGSMVALVSTNGTLLIGGSTYHGTVPQYVYYNTVLGNKNLTAASVHTFKTTQNTQVDPNGFIKAASPIASLYADKIECNDEAKLQDITFEKLGVGDYLIKGSLGFAQEGWYVEMPKDANGNVLVAVIYEQLDNNDISVKTYAKKFDEDTGDIVANTAKPSDIPATRWIDLRLQALPQEDTQPLSKDETVAANAE